MFGFSGERVHRGWAGMGKGPHAARSQCRLPWRRRQDEEYVGGLSVCGLGQAGTLRQLLNDSGRRVKGTALVTVRVPPMCTEIHTRILRRGLAKGLTTGFAVGRGSRWMWHCGQWAQQPTSVSDWDFLLPPLPPACAQPTCGDVDLDTADAQRYSGCSPSTAFMYNPKSENNTIISTESCCLVSGIFTAHSMPQHAAAPSQQLAAWDNRRTASLAAAYA